MSIYQNGIRDPRVREYLPVARILWRENCTGAEGLIGRAETQMDTMRNLPNLILADHGGVLVDFGIELHGGIRLISDSVKGSRIRIRFGESASEAMGSPDQDHAIHDTILTVPNCGMIEYGNTAFRFVRIDAVEGDVRFLNILAVSLLLDLEYAGSFDSSDERLDKIWKTAAYTVHLNMQDYIYDGVKRDRLVWMGDLNPEIRAILSIFRDTSLIPKSLDFLRERTPLPRMMNNITTYSLWWIISIYDYFQHSGDQAWLQAQRKYLIGLLPILCSFVDAEGSEEIPPRRFLDWPNNDNEEALHAGLQGLLFWALKCGAELGKILDFDVSQVKRTVERMAKCAPECGASKAAAAVQTISGLADRSDVILHDRFRGVSTFYGYYMLLAQPIDTALELIRRYWGAMLDHGATTFWEDFDLDWIADATPISELPVPGKKDLHADFGAFCYKGLRHSLCHGWSCGPVPFLSERVLGIRILEPGCRKLAVKPDLADLEYLKATFPTPAGIVRIQAEKGGKVDISAPAGIDVVQ